MVMSVSIKISKYIFIGLLIAMISSCAPAKKNQYYEKRKKNSYVNASQLGKNKYYFSPDYQKKLNKMYKKK
jgi:sortase (surface protein transpeptidase)